MSPVATGLLRLVLLGLGWGLHLVLTRLVGAESGRAAVALLLMYLVGTSLCLCAVARAMGRPLIWRWRYLAYFIGSAALGYVGPVWIELNVAPRIDTSLFALILTLVSVFTVGIAVPLGQARLTARIAGALAAGMAASLLLLGPQLVLPGAEGRVWVLLAFAAPLAYAVGNCFVAGLWPEELDTHQVAAGESVVAVGLGLVLALAHGVGPGDLAMLFGQGWGMIGLMVAASVGTTWLYFALSHSHGAVFVSFAGFIALASGIGWGVLFFGERPGVSLWLAAGLILVALWLLRPQRGEA